MSNSIFGSFIFSLNISNENCFYFHILVNFEKLRIDGVNKIGLLIHENFLIIFDRSFLCMMFIHIMNCMLLTSILSKRRHLLKFFINVWANQINDSCDMFKDFKQ